MKVIQSISSGWQRGVDILQYLPVAFAHFDARPSFTHENITAWSCAEIPISKIERSLLADAAIVEHLQKITKTTVSGKEKKTPTINCGAEVHKKLLFLLHPN